MIKPVPTIGINLGVDGVVATNPDFRVGWLWVTKYYYILIISYNVQEYEMKTRFKVVKYYYILIISYNIQEYEMKTRFKVVKYYYILIISYNVQEYEMKTRFKVGKYYYILIISYNVQEYEMKTRFKVVKYYYILIITYLRSEVKGDLKVRKSKTCFGDRAFSVAGPRCWNNIQTSIRSASTLESFKSRLKTHYFEKSYL